MASGGWISIHELFIFMLIMIPVISMDTSLQLKPYIQSMSIVSQRFADTGACQDSCTFTLVESIPDNLTYSHNDTIFVSTYTAHKRLLEKAKQKIHLASFYWTLTDADLHCPDNTSFQGDDIFQNLLQIVKDGKIEVKIAQNNTNNDTDTLTKFGAQVRTVEFKRLMHAGVLHTKMWVVDDAHIYIGSGNFDWRSYTQTKETGVLIEDCPCLGVDAEKLFEVYWYLGVPNATIPNKWPEDYQTGINISSPALVHYNDTQGYVYLSSSPPPFCPEGRQQDLSAILNIITTAKKFIYISVMDYIPMYIYSYPQRFWPKIDDELRRAAVDRHVKVYLMASHWNHSEPYMNAFLKSLYELNSVRRLNVTIEVKLFTVPTSPIQSQIPYSRVNHSKYMVTDQHAYIGTSNWAGDYFKSTGGVAFILKQPINASNGTSLRLQLVQSFLRDWNSEYAYYVK